jgi:catechol 2,3-dioxygenase-like lactoylglutathione lyase family enzyme
MIVNKTVESPLTKFIHLGIVVKDANATIGRLASLGIGPFQAISRSPVTGSSLLSKPLVKPNHKTFLGQAGDLKIELFEPLEGNSTWKAFLDRKGEGVHHIAFDAEDPFEETDKFIKQGANLVMSTKWQGGGGTYFDIGVGDTIFEFFRSKNVMENTTLKSPFTKFLHLGIVVRDLDATIKRLASFGITGPFVPESSFPIIESRFHGQPFHGGKGILRKLKGKIGDLEVGFYEPGEGKSPWREFLDRKGEGVHHIAFYVDDPFEETAKITIQGLADVLMSTKFKVGGGIYLDAGIADTSFEFFRAG